MIHVVGLANQHLYGRQLDQMFRMRHAYYVEGHKWADLTSADGRETDAFDNDEAVYLMSLDPWGEVAASVRLNPTTGPTLLKKLDHYATEPLPEGEDCWDISRWIADPRHRRGDRARWPSNHQRELMLGLIEFGLARGLTRFSLLAELRLAERIAAYGWPIRHLGEPKPYEGGKGIAVAATFETGFELLAMTRAKTGIHRAVLFEAPASSPPTAEAVLADSDLIAIMNDYGPALVRRMIDGLAREIAAGHGADAPRATELAAALHRLADACVVSAPEPASLTKRSVPRLEAGRTEGQPPKSAN